MCGLVGMAGSDLVQKDRDAFKLMLAFDTIRGKHSTGVAVVNASGNWDLVKRAGTAWDLFETKAYDDLMRFGARYVYIGHNRAATKGKVNNINAHPFEMEDVVGAHNGTIRGQWRLMDNAQFEVDSENIFHSIQEIGLEETLAVLDGAYALSYWDKRSEELVLLRNQERPLYFCFSENRKNVYWASEAWMLSVSLSRSGIKYTEITEIAKNVVYRFDIDRKINGAEVGVRCREFTPFVNPPAKQSNPYSHNSGGKQETSSTQSKKQSLIPSNGLNPNLYLHREVTFLCKGERTGGVYSINYLECEEIEEGLNLRVNSNLRSTLMEEMAANPDIIWKGTIVSYGKNADGSVFYNINPRSIEEWGDTDDGYDIFIGFEDKILTEDEWTDKTKHGCAWCADIPSPDESSELYWVSDDTFVCADCQDTPEVKEYTKQAS